MFLGFANFYRKFIKNFSRIAIPLTPILQTTNDEALSTQATEDKKNKAVSTGLSEGGRVCGVGGSIENLSIIVNLAKSKLTKPKKVGLPNTKVNFRTDFLISKAKEAFIYL